ncbi:MAG TPA: ABC transporter permease [Candidatus Saccharimonadales bacterium]|nr:ABC transporter permease [Candidatus Saccharimonadales bacterium]
MSTVVRGELKMAIAGVRSTKWRSLLTMLGIIIGIVSVVTVVGIGEGVKQQIAGQLGHFGKNLITVVPGNIHDQHGSGSFVGTDIFSGPSAQASLNDQDVRAVARVQGVTMTAPLAQVPGQIKIDGKVQSAGITVIGTSGDLPKLLNQSVRAGGFFRDDDQDQNSAVIGKSVAQRLFQEETPLGMSFEFRGRTLTVRGVFDDFANVPLSPVANFNNTIFIPFSVANKLGNNTTPVYAILVKPHDAGQTATAISAINRALLSQHGGQQDFSVLNAKEAVASTSHVLDLLTKLITGVAAISLLVGGVGIMNVMLVSVTERMHEIGVRKAIGATNRQIWRQFMLEAGVLSGAGGAIGVLFSLLIDLLLHAYSDLKPSISWQAIVVATAVSIAVGVLFGTAPALKAARKDPIEALRHE